MFAILFSYWYHLVLKIISTKCLPSRAIHSWSLTLKFCSARQTKRYYSSWNRRNSRGKHLADIIFKTKWWQYENEMANIVLSFSEIKFRIRSMFFISLPKSGDHSAGPCIFKFKPNLQSLFTRPRLHLLLFCTLGCGDTFSNQLPRKEKLLMKQHFESIIIMYYNNMIISQIYITKKLRVSVIKFIYTINICNYRSFVMNVTLLGTSVSLTFSSPATNTHCTICRFYVTTFSEKRSR